jgi:hypothetical protein
LARIAAEVRVTAQRHLAWLLNEMSQIELVLQPQTAPPLSAT